MAKRRDGVKKGGERQRGEEKKKEWQEGKGATRRKAAHPGKVFKSGRLSMMTMMMHNEMSERSSKNPINTSTYVMRSALSWQPALNAAMLSASERNATCNALSRAPITRDESLCLSNRRKSAATSVMRTCMSVTGTSALNSEYSCWGRYAASPPGGTTNPPLTNTASSTPTSRVTLKLWF